MRPGILVDTQNTGQTSVCGHTNKPLRGEARGGLTTEQAAKNWKMSLQSFVSGRLTPGGYRMARFRPFQHPEEGSGQQKEKNKRLRKMVMLNPKVQLAGARRREARWLRMTTESSCRRSPGRIEASSSPQLPTSAHPIRLLPHPSK